MNSKFRSPWLKIAIFTFCISLVSLYFFQLESFSQTQTLEDKIKSGTFIEHEGFLYVSNGNLVAYDLENPNQPEETFRLNVSPETSKLHIFDNWLIFEQLETPYLIFYDITEGDKPTQVADYWPTQEGKYKEDLFVFDNNIWFRGALIKIDPLSNFTFTQIIFPPEDNYNDISISQKSDLLLSVTTDQLFCVGAPHSTISFQEVII